MAWQQGGPRWRRFGLAFYRRFTQVEKLAFGEAHLNKRALLVLGSVLAASVLGNSTFAKPNQTTKYVYYPISGNTPAAIYATLVKRGPRVGGVKAYAATTAVSSQSGQLVQGQNCALEQYRFKIDFTIKLPKLRNEAALTGTTKTDWNKFSSFLKIHEETHRSIWLACASELEAKVKAVQAKSCAELNDKSTKLWEQMRTSCARKQDAFDVAEQARLLRHPFVRLVLSQGARTTTALVIPKKK
jgi:predicted secreted Zn-dependent protease